MRQLSALLVRNVKHSGGKPSPDKYYDLHGLILRVSPGGRKYWVWRGTVHGRRRDYGLGQYPYMSLAEARQKAFEYRKLALGGTDPKAAGHNVPTFQQAAEKVIRQHRKTWKPGGGSEGQWRSSLDTYAFPHLGKMRVDKITAREVIGCLQDRDFWTRKATTAKRVKKRISLVMQWAVAQGYRGNNPAGDAIDAALGPQPTGKQSFKALPHAEAAAAIAKIRAAKAWAAAGGTGPHRPVAEHDLCAAGPGALPPAGLAGIARRGLDRVGAGRVDPRADQGEPGPGPECVS